MKIIEPNVEIISQTENLMKTIERMGRICYKSEGRICPGSDEKMIKGLIKMGHESVLEHGSINVIWTCSRNIQLQVVRHRIAAYSAESTRYCKYGPGGRLGNDILFIEPSWIKRFKEEDTSVLNPNYITEMENKIEIFKLSLINSEKSYNGLIRLGSKPEEARDVLPGDLKSDIGITYNVREWRHFFKMRCDKHAHPDIRYLAIKTLLMFNEKYSALFPLDEFLEVDGLVQTDIPVIK